MAEDDSGFHRILVWNKFPATSGVPADVIIGGGGPGCSSTLLNKPSNLGWAERRLMVVDQANHRVQFFGQ